MLGWPGVRRPMPPEHQTPIHMKPKQILALLLLYMAVLSGMASHLEIQKITESQWSRIVTTLAGSALIFWWYWADSTSRSYRRSPGLNIAIIGIAFLAVPYYLVRSREPGQRVVAITRLCGFILLMLVTTAIGGAVPAAMFS